MLKTKRGFTLIELLVVIAIIGVLASVVLASLNNARQKGRDAKRISDLKNVQLANESYFDDEGGYAPTLQDLKDGGYLPAVPQDPLGSAYHYVAIEDANGNCTSYHVGSDLENADNSVLDTDADYDSSGATACSGTNGAGTAFNGNPSPDTVYDLRP